MPTSGGRPDIGWLTGGSATWAISQDPVAEVYVLGQAETAANIPWHLRVNNRIMTLQTHPQRWFDGRDGGFLPRSLFDDRHDGWSPDQAHCPQLAYMAYLMTGQPRFGRELEYQASHAQLATYPDDRNPPGQAVVQATQTRAGAWNLRTIVCAAYLTRTGAAMALVEHNLRAMVARLSRIRSFYGDIAGFWMDHGDYNIPARGQPGGEYRLAPWQQDFMAITVAQAARMGFTTAVEVLRLMKGYQVGRFLSTSHGFPIRQGTGYHQRLGYFGADRVLRPALTWAEFGALQRGQDLDNRSWANANGYYGSLSLSALASGYEVTHDRDYRRAHDALLAEQPPYTDARARAREPQHAIMLPPH